MMLPAFAFLVVIGAASFASAKQTAQIPKVIAVHVKPTVSCAKKIGAALQAAGCHAVVRTDVQTTLASMCSFQIINSCDYSSAVSKANGFLNSYKVNSISRPKPVKISPPPAADKASGKSFNPKAEFGFDITGVLEARNSLNLTGTGIKVAIIDTGVYYLHPALGGGFGPGYKVAFGYDLVGDDYDGTSFTTIVPDSDPLDNCTTISHGTHVAGVVAANATKITTPGFVPYASFTGVAPGVTLGAYRIFGCYGSTSSDVVAAAVFRAAQDGADIINLSLGAPGYPDDIAAVAAETVSKAGHIVVAANGNDGAAGAYSVFTPASSSGAIGVADFAVTSAFFLPSYVDVALSQSSSVGLTNDLLLKPDIGAIGSYVYSTISPFAAEWNFYPSAYAIYSGTSFSSPYVAGCIALLLQKRGKIGFDAARAYLQNTATVTNLPTCSPGTNQAALHSPAFQGAGLVHIYKAVTTGTLVTPSSLSLNDTANRKLVETIRIQNNFPADVTFTLSHVAGATANTFNAGDDFVLENPECIYTFEASNATSFSSTSISIAKVKYANTTPYNVTIKAGNTLNVSFQIIAPVPSSPNLWSLYGGYIVITNSFDKIITRIPYAGVAGKWKDRPIWSRNSSSLYTKWGLDFFGLYGLFGVIPASVATGLYASQTFTPLSKLEVVNVSNYSYVLAPAASSSRSANITITYLCSNDTALKALGLQRTNSIGLVDLSTFFLTTPYLQFSGALIRNTYTDQQGLLAPHVYGFDGKVFKGNTTTVSLPAGVYKMDFTARKNFGNESEVDVVTTPPFQLIYKSALSKQTLAKCPV